MNKTIIALAITAALPVAAQADTTISGSVKAVYSSAGTVTTTSALKIASSEVLANGMTATASMNVLTGASGVASLAGDFGTLTMGTIDDDAAFQAGDIGGRIGDSSGTTTTNTTTSGIHYAGSAADLSIAVQTNGTSTQASATYDFNGLALGFATADAAADATNGVNAAMNTMGATYAFGDLSVALGKSSADAKAVGSVTYASTVGAITVSATASSASTSSVSGTYTLDGIAVTAKAARAATGVTTNTMKATYTSGDLTVTANSDNTVSAALDLGNADVSVKRDAGVTTMTYSVAF